MTVENGYEDSEQPVLDGDFAENAASRHHHRLIGTRRWIELSELDANLRRSRFCFTIAPGGRDPPRQSPRQNFSGETRSDFTGATRLGIQKSGARHCRELRVSRCAEANGHTSVTGVGSGEMFLPLSARVLAQSQKVVIKRPL